MVSAIFQTDIVAFSGERDKGLKIVYAPSSPSPGCIEEPQPFDHITAGGDMRVAEERLKAASAIRFRP